MTLPHNDVFIIRATDELRYKGMEFVQEHYKRSFGTAPADEPDHLFVAYSGDKSAKPSILGTIGISLWNPDTLLRLARIYDFEWSSAPLPVVPETIFEYGRLIATRRGLSKALIAVATDYAFTLGRTTGWCEHTDAVHRICLSFGLSFFPVHSTLRYEEIAIGDQEFYRRNPSVKLYMTTTHDWMSVLKDSIRYEDNLWSTR